MNETNASPPDVKNRVGCVMDFLPYPGKYGFDPSKLMDQIRGGDGDALDILLVSKHTSTGTVIKLELIGVFVLSDNGEDYTRVFVIPVEESLQVIDVNPYSQFSENYTHIK